MAVLELSSDSRSSHYRWVILGLAVLCQGGAAVAAGALAPLAPLFQADLGLSKTEVGLFSSAAFAGAWSVMLVAGTLTDRFGIRRITSIGLAVAGALMLSMSAVGTLVAATAVMFTVGMARGTVLPGSTKSIMEWFPPASRATAMGVKQTGSPLAGVLTATMLPVLAIAIGWRYAIAVVGVAVIAAGLIMAVLYRDAPLSAPLAKAKGGIRASLRDVLRNQELWIISSIALFFMMAQQAMIMYLALYYKEVILVPLIPDEQTRIIAAGGYLAVCQTGSAFGRVLWGMVSDRMFHSRRAEVLALIGILSTLVLLSIAQLGPSSPDWFLILAPVGGGLTITAWNGVYHTLVTETVGRRYAATGAGFSLTMIEAGTTLGPPLFGLVADVTGAFRIAWFFLAALSTAGTIMAVISARRVHVAG